MILIHEGVPGSGKSYDAIRKILVALQAGRTVYTNIDGVNLPQCREYISNYINSTADALKTQLVFLERKQVFRFWEHCKEGGFIVIDEAQLFFNSRDFVKEENRIFSDWASTHRHHGFDLLLITQRAARIDTAVRSLAEFRYRYRKLNVFGSLVKKGYLVYTFSGEEVQHMALKKCTYDSAIFPAYNSYEGDATEKNVQKNPNLFNHPIFYALAICLAACIYFIPQSQLLSGDLAALATGKSKTDKINSSKVVPVGNLPLVKQSAPPAIAEGGAAPPGSVDLVALPLDGYIKKGGKTSVMSSGHILHYTEKVSFEMMIAWVKPENVPFALRQVSVN